MSNIPINFRRIAIFLVIIFLVIGFNSRVHELNQLNSQRDEVRTAATESKQTEEALNAQVVYAASTEAVEKWARTEGHYIKEGEQPMIPISQPGSEPVIVATPTPVPTPMPNWQEWWNLFFGQ
ncbi:MAG: septum formation initiator family protein [Chloroflexi bacterium]|nr:septum formation initiator family protein [Chloroflexota bacterium]